MILDNPFKLLGLSATATGREVRRRFDELSVRANLGDRSVSLTADDLSRIRQALEDPVQRIGHEVFWIHGDPAAYAQDDSLAALRDAAGRPASRDQALALHDLAVLTYSSYLAGGDGDAPTALANWAALSSSDDYWGYLEDRAREAADPRLTTDVISKIRRGLPAAVLEPVAHRAAALIDDGDPDAAAELIRAIRQAGLSAEATDAATRLAIAPIRASINDGAAAVEKLIAAVPSSEGATSAVKQRLVEAERALVGVLGSVVRLKRIDPVFDDASLADRVAASARRLSVAVCNHLGDWAWGYVLIRVAVATARTPTFLAQLAGDHAQVCGRYHHSAAIEAAEVRYPLLAAAHAELAIPYARDDEELATWKHLALGARKQGRLGDYDVEKEQRKIAASLDGREAMFRERVAGAADPADGPDPGDDAGVEVAGSPFYRGPGWMRPEPKRRMRPGWWLAGGAVFALVIVGVALSQRDPASRDASDAISASAEPTISATTTSSAPDLAPETPPIVPDLAPETPPIVPDVACAELSQLEDEIDDLDRRIAEKRTLRQVLEARELPLIAELDQIAADYPSNELPSEVWDRYVPLRDEYNRLESKVKTAVRDGNALIRDYNAKIVDFNELRKDC